MNIVILGAGLSGLTTASLLSQRGHTVTILEARKRLGGRIWTKTLHGGSRVEAGATWLNNQHTSLKGLLVSLSIETFPQTTDGVSLFETIPSEPPQTFRIPSSEPPSHRIVGGSDSLINALAATLPPDRIFLDSRATSITIDEPNTEVATADGRRYTGDCVVSTIPPELLVNTIDLNPTWPADLTHLASATHTWMFDSIKFFVAFRTRFWKDDSFSGAAFSQTGLVAEMFDHSSADETTFALKGFLNGSARNLSQGDREEAVVQKLAKYFGPGAKQYLEYGECDWRRDRDTSSPVVDDLFPHQNNGHPIYRESVFGGRLYVSGSETAESAPGYMEGAVHAAHRVARQINDTA